MPKLRHKNKYNNNKQLTKEKTMKVGSKIKRADGTIKTITLYDQLCALGGCHLPKSVDPKTWTKFDRFFHGFTVCARLKNSTHGKKLLKDLNIVVGTGAMNIEQIVGSHKQINNL